MKKKKIKHLLWIIYSLCVFTILWSTLLPKKLGQYFPEDYPKEITYQEFRSYKENISNTHLQKLHRQP